MAVDVFIPAIGVMNGTTPFSGRTYIVADRNYPIDVKNVVVALVLPEGAFCILFCDGFPTAKCSVHSHLNRIVREERGESTRIAPVERLVPLRHQRSNLLSYFWIDGLFLLGEGRQSKADYEP